MNQVMPVYAIVTPMLLVAYSVLAASVNRVVLRPQDRGFLWLKLGVDELRQAVVLLVLGIILFLALMVSLVAASVVVALALGASGGAAAMAPGSPATAAAVGATFLLTVIATFAIMAKLSLASPLTFDLGRIEIFGSWRLTQGRFWPMLGAYLLAFVMLLFVSMLIYVIYAAIASVATGAFSKAFESLRGPSLTLSGFLSPLSLLYLVFNAATGALTNAIWFGVAPRAYQQLKGHEAASVFR